MISVSAANAQIYQNILVQKTATQLCEYNFLDSQAMYTRPVLNLHWANKYWGYLTTGMSEAELKDFEQARDQLEHYNKIYSFVEYSSVLHDNITCL